MSSRLLRVTARRRVGASRERVFRAFTEPGRLARWFSPGPEIGTEVLALDLRKGGAYRLRFRMPGGEAPVVTGRYLEIEPPARLVFTWTWEAPDPHAGTETRVTVELVRRGEGTEVTVTHDAFPDEPTRARHEDGWRGTLARLESTLAKEDP